MRNLLIIIALMLLPVSAQSHEEGAADYTCHTASDGQVHCHIHENR